MKKIIQKLCERNREMLPCPNQSCDNNGTITVADESGDASPEQCQFCDYRNKATQQTAEAVLSAVVEIGKGLKVTDADMEIEPNASATIAYNQALDDLLTQLTNKDI